MPTPSLDANFVFPANASGEWTVSPEFGDAMRERPSARMPRPRRLTMKTRIAVRAETPHRFEVVPLRDVHRRAPSPMFKQVTPLANARVRLRSVNAEATVRNVKAGRQGPTRGRENVKPPPGRVPRGKSVQFQPSAMHAKSASLSSLHPPSQIPYILKRRAIYTQALLIPKIVEELEGLTLVEEPVEIKGEHRHAIVVELMAAIDLAIGEWERMG